jgi:pentatricopeptide repeat protein
MFTCSSCLRRAVRTLAILEFETAHSGTLLPSKKLLPALNVRESVRGHATIASIQKGHHLKLLREALQSKKIIVGNARERRKPSAITRRNARAKEANAHILNITKDEDANSALWSSTVDKALQNELKWTGGDAVKLAASVLEKLKNGKPLRALELVRASEKMPDAEGQKEVDNVVSWNHVMDYYMSTGYTREAFKVFNEVRKLELRLPRIEGVVEVADRRYR